MRRAFGLPRQLAVVMIWLLAAAAARAHVVQQIYARLTLGEGNWRAEVVMDAGYAWPEGRSDPNLPQPSRQWLETRTRAEYRILREESEKLLRAHLEFRSSGGGVLPWACRFPDFDSFPPAFPEVPGDFAFLTVLVEGTLAPGGNLSVTERTGEKPDFVFRTGEDAYLTLKPGQSLVLAAGTASADTGTPALAHFAKEGFLHVLPLGWDHILFILAMFLLDRRLRPVLWQSLCFTAAHTVTLGLAAAGVVTVPGEWVEPLIALSIAAAAMENLISRQVRARRLLLVFAFGLVHGLGFGGALAAILDQSGGMIPLVAANLGVEAAQVVILLAAALIFCLLPGDSVRGRTALVLNILLVAAGLTLTVLRLRG